MTAQPVETAEWLTVREYAALLRLSRRNVYRLVALNRLPHQRAGRGIRIPATAAKPIGGQP